MLNGGKSCTWEIKGLSTDIDKQCNICPLKPEEKCPAQTYALLAARYFLDYFTLLNISENIKSDTDLKQRMRDIRFSSAEDGGKDLRALSENGGLADLVKYYWSKFPTVEVDECSENRLVCRAHSCAFQRGYVDMGFTSEDTKRFAELGCICDEAAVKGFNPYIKFVQNSNLMNGDNACEWVLTLEKK